MRTGIDAKRLFFNHTGLGNYGRAFAHALAAGLPVGDEITLFAPKPVENSPFRSEFDREPFSVKIPAGAAGWFGGAAWRSFFLKKELAADGFGAYYGLSNELPFGIQKLPVKTAVVIHDLIFLKRPDLYPKVDAFFYKKKTKYAAEFADRVIAVSEQTKRDLIEIYRIREDRISVIPPIVEDIFYSENSQIVQNIHQSTFENYILSIGSINPRKNLLLLIEAFSLIEKKYDTGLVVVGEPAPTGRKYFQEIKQFVADRKLESRIRFLGKVGKAELPGLYQNALFTAYPSQIEGFGMPLAESLFCGTPVVTSRGGCFEEAAGPGGLFINPKNVEELAAAMDKLAADPVLRKQLSEAGGQHVQQFRADVLGGKIAAFHRELTGQS